MNGIVRRHRPGTDKPMVCGTLRYDPASMQLTNGRSLVNISRSEGLMIGELIRNAGHPVSHDALSEAIWGSHFPRPGTALRYMSTFAPEA